jgi:carbon monoxide dehydrogenase subunit G
MEFSGRIEVAAPAIKVWDFLNDIDRFSSCLPGLDKVTQIDERTFDGVIGAAVGPISGKFSFRATIVESTPPTAPVYRDEHGTGRMVVRTEGTDSVTKSKMSGDLSLSLDEPAPSRTELNYRASVEIKGRLAILGDMVMRATATLLLEEFARRLRGRLEKGEKDA